MDPDFIARAAAIRKADTAKKQAEALDRGRSIKEAALRAQEDADRARAEESALIQDERDKHEAEKLRCAQAAKAELERAKRQQQETSEELERQRQESARSDLRDRQRREEERRRGHKEAEMRAEAQANQLREIATIQEELVRARSMKLLDQHKFQATQATLHSLNAEQRGILLKEVHQLFDDQLRADGERKEAAVRQRQEYEGKILREAALEPKVTEFPQATGPSEQERLQQRRSSAKTQADEQAARLMGYLALDDVPRALKRPASRDVAVLALQKHVVAIVCNAGMEGLAEFAATGFGEMPLESMLRDIATIYLESPANVPALLILGLLGFCGHAGSYKTVRLLNVIPDNPNEWIGWLLGCRLFFEYSEWYTMKSGDAKRNDQWRLQGMQASRFTDRRGPVSVGGQKGRISQRKGAEAKVYQLFDGFPGMPSHAVGEVMKMFEELANALDRHQLKVTDVMQKLDESPQDPTMDLEAHAQRVLEAAQVVTATAAAARREADSAESAMRKAEGDIHNLKLDLEEKRALLTQSKKS